MYVGAEALGYQKGENPPGRKENNELTTTGWNIALNLPNDNTNSKRSTPEES